jgi:hypothetical protein
MPLDRSHSSNLELHMIIRVQHNDGYRAGQRQETRLPRARCRLRYRHDSGPEVRF